MEDLLVDYLTVDLVQQAAVGHDLLQRICDEMDNPEQNYSMQDLIESLEPSLTSNDDKERWKATFLLAEIFGKKEFASDVLTSSVLHLFLIFFCRRCTDFPSITPSLQAISSILRKYHGLLDGKYCDILDIVLTIVKEIHIPSYAQNIRQLAMEILSFIFQHEGISKQLTANAMEVVDGVINTMEEEKDPRCLVLALQLLAKVSKTFPEVLEDSITTQLQVDSDYETLAEKLFDNTSCYFPISFSPPPDDPFGITTEDLVEALEAAMCASIPIIKFSIPFFIEQINSEQVSARIYALHGLLNIVQEFGHVVFRQRAIDHRSGRMSELLAGENEEHKPYLLRLSQLVFDVACVEASNEILEQVYRLVGGITYSIGKDVVGKYASDWQTFHGYILSKVHNEVLKSPTSIDSLKMKAMWKLTLSIGSAGGCFTAAIIVKQFMPILLERVQRSLHMTQLHLQRYLQASLQNVKILTSFTNEERIVPSSIQMLESLVTCALPLSMDVTAMEDLNPLKEYQDAIFEALTGFVLNIRNLTFAATATTTAMVSEEEEVKTNKLEGDISLALMMSMHAMAEWFLRSKGQAMQPQKVTAYLHLMIEIAIQGFPALLSFLDSSMVAAVESRLSLNDENNMLQSAAGDLFVKLINLQTNKEGLIDFQGIILTSCLPRLLQSIVQIPTADQVASADFCSSHSKRCQLLTKLIIANTNASIWSQVLESLIPAIVNCVQTLASHGTDEVAAKTALFVLQQWLDIFVNVLPRETTGDVLKSLQIKIIHLVGCKEGVALDLKTSPLLTLAQAVFALPVGWEGKKDIQAKLLAIQHSFHTLLSIAMSYLSVSQQDVFYQTFFATFPDSFAQQVTRPDHFGGAEVLLALLCHYDKQGQCFQASTFSNSCSPYTGFQLANVIMNRLKMSSSASSDREVEAEAKCFSVIVNKLKDSQEVNQLLQAVLDLVSPHLQGSGTTISSVTMQLFIWTLKAITLRPVLSRGANSQSWQEVFLTTFMTCLSADVSIASTKEASSSSAGTVAEYCANQMMVLIQEPSSSSSTTTTSSSSSNTSAISILTKASKGHFNMFWQQKLYLTLYPIFNQKLTDMLAQASSSVNTGSIHQEVLTAICKLIQGISSQLLKSNMSELKSSMMKILSFLHVQEQQSQQQGGMKKINTEAMLALQRMIQEDVSIFVEQLHIIIPRLLQIAQQHPEAKVRAAALECLAILPQRVPYPPLHPHRKTIEKGLLVVLDDKKRAIRQLAAQVRNEWILIE